MGCPLAVITDLNLADASLLCKQQTYDSLNPQCFVGNCQLIMDGVLITQNACNENSTEQSNPFIYDSAHCHSEVCANINPSAKAFDAMKLFPSSDVPGDETICIEKEFYMGICLLLTLALATFMCFTMVGMYRLK